MNKILKLYEKKLDILIQLRKQEKISPIDEIGHLSLIVILYHIFDNHTAAYILLGAYLLGLVGNAITIYKHTESINLCFHSYENEINRLKYEKRVEQ